MYMYMYDIHVESLLYYAGLGLLQQTLQAIFQVWYIIL